jgi:hypothetical protein
VLTISGVADGVGGVPLESESSVDFSVCELRDRSTFLTPSQQPMPSDTSPINTKTVLAGEVLFPWVPLPFNCPATIPRTKNAKKYQRALIFVIRISPLSQNTFTDAILESDKFFDCSRRQ